MKGGDVGQLNAELRKHFFEATMLQSEEETENRWFRNYMSALVMKGEGVLKTLERKKLAWAGYSDYTKKLTSRLDDPTDPEYGQIAQNSDEDSRRRVLLGKAEEYKKGHPYPIVTTDVPPEIFKYFKTLEGFSLCAEVKKVPYLSTLDQYNAGLTRSGTVVSSEALGAPRSEWESCMDGVPELDCWEVWDCKNVTTWLSGPGQLAGTTGTAPPATKVKTIAHRYGDATTKTLRGPYAHALGITTHSRLPHRAGLGILYGFLPLFKLLDSLLTIQSNAAYLTGFPAYAEDGTAGIRLPPAMQGDYGDANETGASRRPGGMLRVIPGRVLPAGIKPIDQPRGSVVIDKVMQDVRAFIELALPSIVQGMVQGDSSGYAVNQAAYLARLAWTPIVDNGQYGLARKVSFESWLIENTIKETVYAWGEQPTGGSLRRRGPGQGWLSLGRNDLNGNHRYIVKLDPDTPANRVIDAKTHEGLVMNRFETIDDARIELGKDPEAVERWWQLYDLKQDPEVQNKIKEETLRNLRIIQQKRLLGTGPGQADLTQPGPEQAGNPLPGPGAAATGTTPGIPGQPPQTAPPGAVQGGFNNGLPYQPGQGGTPLIPPPPSTPGAPGGPPRGIRGRPPGAPPGTPTRHLPLPGQGGSVQ